MHDVLTARDDDARPLLPVVAEGAARRFFDWLLADAWKAADPATFTERLALALLEAGLPLFRLRLVLRTLHPQFIGANYTWTRGGAGIEEFLPPHSIVLEERYLASPMAAIFSDGAAAIRRRLAGTTAVLDFPVLVELRDLGATDYVALALELSGGKRSALTLATDRPEGFASTELAMVDAALPLLARIVEVHTLRRTAETILRTYLGGLSGERVLRGLIRRGDFEDIFAVLWFADMRGSTRLADRLPRKAYLDLINDYHTCVAEPVLDRGGQVLAFLGDGVFAIFPIGNDAARAGCEQAGAAATAALAAAREAMARMARLNERRIALAEEAIGYGIGLHLGEVAYGNVGVPNRLDFTVIGPAANEAARLQQLCKTLQRPVVISAALAAAAAEPLIGLGSHALRGVREPVEVFTLP